MDVIADDGVKLAASESGPTDGPAVLLIAGTSMDQGLWGVPSAALAEDHRVVTYDSRDVGGSQRATAEYDTAQLAADAVAVLDTLGIERAHIAGLSLGGCVCQQLALRCPERIASVLTASTWARPDAHLRAQFEFWIELAKQAGWPMVFRLQAFMAFSNETLEMLGESIYDLGDAMAADFDLSAFCRQVRADLTHSLDDEELAGIEAPFLSLWGDADLLVPRRHAEHLAEVVPNGRFGILEGVSHSVTVDHPERFTEALQSWLAEQVS